MNLTSTLAALRRLLRSIWTRVKRGAPWPRHQWTCRDLSPSGDVCVHFAAPPLPPVAATFPEPIRVAVERARGAAPSPSAFTSLILLARQGVRLHARLQDSTPEARPALLCVRER
jgi:hypothetical protein